LSYGDKIRYFQKENGGVVSALNFGIEHMQGEYFAWLSHDDFYLPDKIEKQVQALQKYKGDRPAFCVCNCLYVDEKGVERNRGANLANFSFDDPVCFLFLGNGSFNGVMVLIPKSLFDICGKFSPSIATHEYEMWLRLMDVAEIVIIPKYLVAYRLHEKQVSRRKKHEADAEIDPFLADGIKGISSPVFESYFKKRLAETKDARFVLELLNSYVWYQPYYNTSQQLFTHIYNMCTNNPKQCPEHVKALYTLLLGHPHTDTLHDMIISNVSKKSNSKKRIVIYCDSVVEGSLRGMSAVIDMYSPYCEIIILSHWVDEVCIARLSAVNVKFITLTDCGYIFTPVRIFMLGKLLNTDILWYYAFWAMKYTGTFHYLKVFDICSIATIHHSEIPASPGFTPEPRVHLKDANFVTVQTLPSDTFHMLYSCDVLLFPDDLRSITRWKEVFDCLLAADSHSKVKSKLVMDSLLDGNASEIKHKTTSDIMHAYIKNYMIELDYKINASIAVYENRSFWRLTKPLRVISNRLRMIAKQIYKRNKVVRSIVYRVRKRTRGVSA